MKSFLLPNINHRGQGELGKFSAVLALLLLSGCLPQSPPSPALEVTAVSEQIQPSEMVPTQALPGTFAPLTEETPAIVIEPPIPLPTITPIPASVGVPLEELALIMPGPGSLERNPIQIEGYGGPSQNNRVQLRLYGEDGRLIAQGFTFLYSYPGRPGQFFAEVPFETPLVAETGWLEVRSFGDRYGLLRHLIKVQINLLSTGSERIYPTIRGAEKLTLFNPREDERVSGRVDRDKRSRLAGPRCALRRGITRCPGQGACRHNNDARRSWRRHVRRLRCHALV